jgi:alkylation response protein AidB-like acyl-CoA dehydrogenase
VAFVLTAEQQELGSVLAGYLAARVPIASVHDQVDSGGRPADSTSWRLLCDEMGVHAVDLDDKFGGVGLTAVELAVVMEAAGGELYSGPLLASTGLALGLAMRAGTPAADRLLERAAAGEVLAAAVADDGRGWEPGRIETVAAEAGGGWRVTGGKRRVLQADLADVLLIAARLPSGRLGLLAADPASVIIRPRSAIDPTRLLCDVELSDTPATLISDNAAAAVAAAGLRAGVALAAEAVGAARRCLRDAASYAAERRQFGQPIGAFQGVKHQLADCLVDIELATSAVYLAACHVAADDLSAAGAAVPMALTTATEALATVSARAVQVYGGLGFTWESDCHLFVKRAQASRYLLGDPARRLNAVYERASALYA